MEEMTNRQSFALKCATGLDVRGLDISKEQARLYLNSANESEMSHRMLCEDLILQGALGKPKVFKKYVKGQKKSRKSTRTKVVKKSRDQEFQAILDKAVEAGKAAAEACNPTPMIVAEHTNPLDDNSPIKRLYAPVMDGICGFARVELPGNTAFAKWLVEKGIARKQERGVGINIWEYNQSYERKCAHASAMARSLQDQGIKKVRTWTYVD